MKAAAASFALSYNLYKKPQEDNFLRFLPFCDYFFELYE